MEDLCGDVGIVAGHLDLGDFIQDALSIRDYSSFVFEDAPEALHYLGNVANPQPPVLIVDYSLDGFPTGSFVWALLRMKIKYKYKIILMADASASDLQNLKHENKVEAVIGKPFDLMTLYGLMHELFRTAAAYAPYLPAA